MLEPSKATQKYNFFGFHNHIIIRCALMRFPSPPRDGLKPDWLTKAAGQKLPHRGRAFPQPSADRQPSESFSLPEWDCDF